MNRQSGTIYNIGDGRYGIAYHADQSPAFRALNKVYVHVYTDVLCTRPEINSVTGRQHVTLKNIKSITQIGFSD